MPPRPAATQAGDEKVRIEPFAAVELELDTLWTETGPAGSGILLK